MGHGNELKGLTLFDKTKEVFTNYRHDPKNPFSISSESVVGILQDAQWIIWLAHLNGSLDKYDEKSHQTTVFEHDPDNPESVGHNSMAHFYQDADGFI